MIWLALATLLALVGVCGRIIYRLIWVEDMRERGGGEREERGDE